MGQQVEVLRSNGTWSRGYINGVHRGGPHPHLVIRFVNKTWKRVLISEVEANIRPHVGEEILESLLEPAGATPKARDDFGGADDDISDTELLRACVQWEQCWTACHEPAGATPRAPSAASSPQASAITPCARFSAIQAALEHANIALSLSQPQQQCCTAC